MDAIAHIAIWQKTITAIPGSGVAMLVLITLLAIAWPLAMTRMANFSVQRERVRDALAPPPPLEQLFSNGLLNPKTF